jgi:hypothetical protein
MLYLWVNDKVMEHLHRFGTLDCEMLGAGVLRQYLMGRTP